MTTDTLTRRIFLGSSAVAAVVAAQPRAASATTSASGDHTATPSGGFTYEITRTDAEWREMLGPDGFAILREGGTEAQGTSPLRENRKTGSYACRGCDLPLFTSRWQTYPGPGWVFFRQAEIDTVLIGIDLTNPYGGGTNGEVVPDILALIETHCRRCGSHLGHVVSINNAPLHCVNGTAVTFTETTA